MTENKKIITKDAMKQGHCSACITGYTGETVFIKSKIVENLCI